MQFRCFLVLNFEISIIFPFKYTVVSCRYRHSAPSVVPVFLSKSVILMNRRWSALWLAPRSPASGWTRVIFGPGGPPAGRDHAMGGGGNAVAGAGVDDDHGWDTEVDLELYIG